MNEIKSLIWLEWKKSSVLVGGVFTAIFIILTFLAMSGIQAGVENLLELAALFIFSYLIGLVFLILVTVKAGQDLKTDEFVFLLMSPVKPWKHITSRMIFCIGLLFVYFLFVSLIPISFLYNYWVGDLGNYIKIILVLLSEHLTMVIVPLVCFSLLTSMVIVSFREKTRRLSQAIMGLALAFSMFSGLGAITKLQGSVFPDYKIEMLQSISLNPEVMNEIKKRGDIDFKFESNSSSSSMNNNSLKMDGQTIDFKLPLFIEPQLIILLISALSILAAVQIWKEVEL
jgi:hypothetical protein